MNAETISVKQHFQQQKEVLLTQKILAVNFRGCSIHFWLVRRFCFLFLSFWLLFFSIICELYPLPESVFECEENKDYGIHFQFLQCPCLASHDIPSHVLLHPHDAADVKDFSCLSYLVFLWWGGGRWRRHVLLLLFSSLFYVTSF